MPKGIMTRVCDECGEPQFHSPSGWVCTNGHGGANWHLEEVIDYRRKYLAWRAKIKDEINKAHWI